MKKLFTASVIATSLFLSGCMSAPKAPSDPSPIVLKPNDSFAMKVLKSGYDYVPFDIKDTKVPENAYQNTLNYGTSAGLGLLSGGLSGSLSGLGMAALMNLGGHPHKDYIHYIAWVPADNIDIKDTAAIDAYVKKNYLKPALDSYIASDYNQSLERPAEFLEDAEGIFRVKGELCFPVMHGKDEYDGCQMFWKLGITPVRYATEKIGMPFTPSIKAKRYIVARITDARYRSAVLLGHIKTNMMYAFVPKLGYQAEQINRLVAKPVISEKVPYVAGMKPQVSLFIKPKK